MEFGVWSCLGILGDLDAACLLPSSREGEVASRLGRHWLVSAKAGQVHDWRLGLVFVVSFLLQHMTSLAKKESHASFAKTVNAIDNQDPLESTILNSHQSRLHD